MPSDDPDRSLDEAREILFGPHQRAHETRLAQVEAALASRFGESDARADAVEQRLALRVDQAVEQLSGRIAALEAQLRSCEERLRMLDGENRDEAGND